MSIVARNEGNLQKALAQLEVLDFFRSLCLHLIFFPQTSRANPNQILRSYSYSLGTERGAAEALEAACEPHGGQTPDAVFLCAGKSTPGFFVEQTEETMRKGMDDTYWLSAWSAMVRSLFRLALLPWA